MLADLARSVAAHSGDFHCVQIHGTAAKTVRFQHRFSDAGTAPALPLTSLAEFYATFGGLTLFLDPVTHESAFEIVPPSQWPTLAGHFTAWLEGLSEDEAEEYLPSWIDDCAAVGEIPGSGNYLLVPLSGADAGKLFEFEHDGFEFIELAPSLGAFVAACLDLDASRLSRMASHLRFIESDPAVQWWIEKMVDNRGNTVTTGA